MAGTGASVAHCPGCESESAVAVGRIPDAAMFAGRVLDSPVPGGFLWECRRCGLIFKYPKLGKEDLDSLYRQADADVWQTPELNRPDWLMTVAALSAQDGGSVLDIGCFDGGFLRMLGKSWQKFGIEINESAIHRAMREGVDIIGRDFDALESHRQQFDVITAFDVIEHVDNPERFLVACRQALRPGGLLILATGNARSWPWRLHRARNLYCICAEHLVFLTPCVGGRCCPAPAFQGRRSGQVPAKPAFNHHDHPGCACKFRLFHLSLADCVASQAGHGKSAK